MKTKKKIKVTPEKFLKEMEEISNGDDTEVCLGKADSLMCEILIELGYGKGIEVFQNMEKWYA